MFFNQDGDAVHVDMMFKSAVFDFGEYFVDNLLAFNEYNFCLLIFIDYSLYQQFGHGRRENSICR